MGALTSKPYSFIARSWELVSFTVPNFMDIGGSIMRFDFFGSKLARILPQVNQYQNLLNTIISDRVRFSYDGYNNNRLQFKNLEEIESFANFSYSRNKLINTLYVVDSFLNLDSTLAIIGSVNSCNGSVISTANTVDSRSDYVVINSLEHSLLTSDCSIFIEVDPFSDLSIYSSILYKLSSQNQLFSIGSNKNSNMINISSTFDVLYKFLSGTHKFCTKVISFKSLAFFYDVKLPSAVKVVLNAIASILSDHFGKIITTIPLNFFSNVISFSEIYQGYYYKFNNISNFLEFDQFIFIMADSFCFNYQFFNSNFSSNLSEFEFDDNNSQQLPFITYIGTYCDRMVEQMRQFRNIVFPNITKSTALVPVRGFLEDSMSFYNTVGKYCSHTATLPSFDMRIPNIESVFVNNVFSFYVKFMNLDSNNILFSKILSQSFFITDYNFFSNVLLNFSCVHPHEYKFLYGFSEFFHSDPFIRETFTRLSINVALAAKRFHNQVYQ
jgi:hypothetical protein